MKMNAKNDANDDIDVALILTPDHAPTSNQPRQEGASPSFSSCSWKVYAKAFVLPIIGKAKTHQQAIKRQTDSIHMIAFCIQNSHNMGSLDGIITKV